MPAREFLKVYGFPRSGNHFLMALLAANFYQKEHLATPGGQVGHWADRATVPNSEHGQLAGHHFPPRDYDPRTALYIYRDGRAAAASLWRSPHFVNPAWKAQGMTFSEFIRTPLDWSWSPGMRWKNQHTVIGHWWYHLELWRQAPALYKVQYEWLCADPGAVLDMIASRTDDLTIVPQAAVPGNLVGWFPSGGTLDGWRELWSAEDTAYFFEIVPREFYGVYEREGVAT
jgi:hypothetical protein